MTNSQTIALACSLVARASLTPDDCGCSFLISRRLAASGFNIQWHNFGECTNLLATHGVGSPFILFLGHTDVVPAGDEKLWDHGPFSGAILNYQGQEVLFGRGSADMKGSDAAMCIALEDFVKKNPNHQGTIGLLLTSNEEGDGKGGIKEVARILKESGNIPDFCIVGEPSSEKVFGDTVKVGRRGSLSVLITVEGTQGHVAYPERVDNPIHKVATLISKLSSRIDNGNEFFPPTSFEVTNIHAGTGAENVVPATCEFLCNFRFNNLQSKESLEQLIKAYLNELNIKATLDFRLNGLPFITENSQDPQSTAFKLRQAISISIEEVTGLKTQFSTSGGTSDGRFIAPLGAQVIEFGPLSATIHKVNEHVLAEDLNKLTTVYFKVIEKLLT